MSEQWTTVIHDASEAPLKDGGYFIEISYPSGVVEWTDGLFSLTEKRWYGKDSGRIFEISRWCEKPPAQKKKERKEIPVFVAKDNRGNYHAFPKDFSFSCISEQLGVIDSHGKLIFEE